MTQIEPKPEPPREEGGVVPVVAVLGLLLVLLVLLVRADARPIVGFAPDWVVIVEPPVLTDCRPIGWRVDGVAHAATVEALPGDLGAVVTPYTTTGAARIFCDGIE